VELLEGEANLGLGVPEFVALAKHSLGIQASDEFVQTLFKELESKKDEKGQPLAWKSKSGGLQIGAGGVKELITDSELLSQETNRYWVLLSLAEAETIRRVLHIRIRQQKPLFASGTCVALHCITASDLVMDRSISMPPPPEFQRHLSHQSIRFLDCELMFSESDIAALLYAMPETPPARRKIFFKNLLMVRRRARNRFEGSPVAQLFNMPDQWTLIKAKAWQQKVRKAIADQGLGLADAFNMFDSDGNSKISASELFGALNWLGLPHVTARDILEFMVILDTDQDMQVSWEEFSTLLSPPEDEFGEEQKAASLATTVKREDLPEKVEAYGKEELEQVRKKMAKQAEVVESEEKRAAVQEKEDQKRWHERYEEQEAWAKQNPRAQWKGPFDQRSYQINFDFFQGTPPAKITTLGICTTKEDCMLLEIMAHLHIHTDLRVHNFPALPPVPGSTILGGARDDAVVRDGEEPPPGPPPLSRLVSSRPAGPAMPMLARQISRPAGNGGSQHARLNVYTLTLVLQLTQQPAKDMPIFKALHTNEKEGTVYITPNGTLKVCGNEGYKVIPAAELALRSKQWPVLPGRWCVVSIVVDLNDKNGAKFKGYIDGISVMEYSHDDMNIDGMFSLSKQKFALFLGAEEGSDGSNQQRMQHTKQQAFLRTVEFETRAYSKEEVIGRHDKLMCAAYEHEMLKSPSIAAGDFQKTIDTLKMLESTKEEVVLAAFYLWCTGRGGLPDMNKIASNLTQRYMLG